MSLDDPANVLNGKGAFSTLPNRITLLRFVAVPALLGFASAGKPMALSICLVLALLTDLLDGFAARRMGLVSEFGARLDTYADLAIYVTLPICAWRLYPDLVERELGYVVIAVLSYALPVIVGLTKYGRIAAYHTWSAKISSVLMAVTVLPLLAFQVTIPFRIATFAFALAGIENILISVMLSEWTPDIKSLAHAIKVRQNVGDTARQEPRPPVRHR